MFSLFSVLFIHPVLVLPESTKPFQIESNASDTAVGGAFTQEHTSVNKPISFLSNTLSSSEKKYSFYDHELHSSIIYCKAWCHCIDRQ